MLGALSRKIFKVVRIFYVFLGSVDYMPYGGIQLMQESDECLTGKIEVWEEGSHSNCLVELKM